MIGIDIENIDRFIAFNEKQLNRIFTKKEIEYAKKYDQPEIHYTGFWCAKEAFIKAIKIKDIPLKDIEILHKENGAPYIEVEKLTKYLYEKNCSFIDLSISHTKEVAISVVELN